jgi:hypothetical protein
MFGFVSDSIVVRIESLYVMDRNATTMEKKSRNTLIKNEWRTYRERERRKRKVPQRNCKE